MDSELGMSQWPSKERSVLFFVERATFTSGLTLFFLAEGAAGRAATKTRTCSSQRPACSAYFMAAHCPGADAYGWSLSAWLTFTAHSRCAPGQQLYFGSASPTRAIFQALCVRYCVCSSCVLQISSLRKTKLFSSVNELPEWKSIFFCLCGCKKCYKLFREACATWERGLCKYYHGVNEITERVVCGWSWQNHLSTKLHNS